MTVTSQDQERAKAKTRTGAMKSKNTVKRRNAPATALADPRYRAQAVRSAKAYTRKNKTEPGEGDDA